MQIIDSMKESLKELTALKQNSCMATSLETNDNSDFELSNFLEHDDSRQNIAYDIIQRYGINSTNIKCFQNKKASMPSEATFDQNLQLECQEAVIKYLSQKLQQEQMNRLKTEEQSARVIEQLGHTIHRIDFERQKGSMSNPRKSVIEPYRQADGPEETPLILRGSTFSAEPQISQN